MINAEELALCRRRGHDAKGLKYGWAKCNWCGMWLREVVTIEEREDEPPEIEKSPITSRERKGK